MSRDLLRTIGTVSTAPIRYAPNGIYKDRLRAYLWRQFGAPRENFPLYLPRRALLIDAGDTVLEIGAMNPETVDEFAKLATRDGQVYIFEPTKTARTELEPRAAAQQNVTLDSRGIWPEPGNITISSDPDYAGGGRVRDPEVNDELPPLNDPDDIAAKVAPLDTVVEEYGIEPDFIEVLTNGTEFDVLSSGLEVLRKYRPRLLCKTYGYTSSGSPKRTERLLTLLRSEGYQLEFAPMRVPDPEWDALAGDVYAWHPEREY
ncbi:FkbM family methyltransferase [Halosimplex amylolyticum]|uniref:FkbM family methyltransferase n=1 Tax=Halosimplex amylolyticum TaxID=3396616 RepID=UPI003F551506